MSLLGTLNIGSSALATQQAALQVTSNNIANAGNADYSRETASVVSNPDQQIKPGVFVGSGINLSAISRQVDDALNDRLRSSMSDSQSASTTQQYLGRVESVFNELSDSDLSSQLSTFFNSWSSLANQPSDVGLRQVVLQNGDALAKFFQNVRTQFGDLQSDVGNQLSGLSTQANDLIKQVADLNSKITVAEGGTGGQASGLRDQRDSVLKQLAQLVDIHTVNDGTNVNVFVGSQPLVQGTSARQITTTQSTVNNAVSTSVVFKDTGAAVPVTSGQIGSLLGVQTSVSSVSSQIDNLAGSLIFELNKVYSGGQALDGFSSTASTNLVADPTAALDSAAAKLPFTPANGSFTVQLRDKSTGQTSTSLISVSLGSSSTSPTTLNSLAASINAVPGITATVNGGQLKIATDDPNQEIFFGDDTSGALAALGINSFYTGKDATDIAVNSALTADPRLLAAASTSGGANGTALALAGLQDQPLGSLGGNTLTATYQATVNGVATSVSAATTSATAAAAVSDTLTQQQQALSGVSLDEESINLLQQQRAYQGAARVISVVDQMMQTILQMVQ